MYFSETLSFLSGHGFSALAEKSEKNWRVKFPGWGNFMFSENIFEPLFLSHRRE
jgi:hypothetical protein